MPFFLKLNDWLGYLNKFIAAKKAIFEKVLIWLPSLWFGPFSMDSDLNFRYKILNLRTAFLDIDLKEDIKIWNLSN